MRSIHLCWFLISAIFVVSACVTLPAHAWEKTFELKEYLKLCDFPDQVISYEVDFTDAKVRPEDLVLRNSDGQVVPHQLTDVQIAEDGRLASARVLLRTDLPRGGTRKFMLTTRGDAQVSAFAPAGVVEPEGDDRAVLRVNRQAVRVPYGMHDYGEGRPAAEVPAPILGVADGQGHWVGAGAFETPGEARVIKLEAGLIENGPLMARYQIRYAFNNDRSYRVELTLYHDDAFVSVSEFYDGFSVEDPVRLRFSLVPGLDPDHRLALGNGGYEKHSGEFGREVRTERHRYGKLPFELGLYSPNSNEVVRAATLYRAQGDCALLLAVHSLPQWEVSKRHIWNSYGEPAHLHLYQTDDDKYMRTTLAGRQRHWAIGVIPRQELVVNQISAKEVRSYPVGADIKEVYSRRRHGGPEIRLLQRLNDFSLDRYKDLVFEWDEDLSHDYTIDGRDESLPLKMTYEGFIREFFGHYGLLADLFWDNSGDLGGNHWGWANEWIYPAYLKSRKDWTPEQRQHARALLVFRVHLQDMDIAMPHQSMMSGHPNFVVAMKQGYAIAAATFPKHPHAQRWKDEFLRFWDEFLTLFVRPGDPTTNALPGRWTENVTCYNFASMESCNNAAQSLFVFDGTRLFAHPIAQQWLNWNMHTLVPFYEGNGRIVPPQGAHARLFEVEPGGRWHTKLNAIARLEASQGSEIGQYLLWCTSGGREGKQPQLESQVFQDYGAVLRYDFGGPNEAYLNVQELFGRGYRWNTRANGSLYYAAKGRRLSWNAMETSGDQYDQDQLPLFNINGQSLGARAERNVLYNFDAAQYYLAQGNNPQYTGRGVMMVRDDFIAVYDHVVDGAEGKFQWVNESSGLRAEYFNDPEFKQLVASRISDLRFPIAHNWDAGTPHPAVTSDAFSVRWTGLLQPRQADTVTIAMRARNAGRKLGRNDRGRLWLDDQLVLDSAEKEEVTITLEARPYRFRCEYTHGGGDDAAMHLIWQGPKTHLDPLQSVHFRYLQPMPQIVPVKAGPGDNLHIVSAEALSVVKQPWGAQVGEDQFVFMAGKPVEVEQGPAAFRGTVGYARPGELYLFEGDRIRLGDLALSRNGGEFGVSVRVDASGKVSGRIAGREGGRVEITLPQAVPAGARVFVGGEAVDADIRGQTVSFDVAIGAADGYRVWELK